MTKTVKYLKIALISLAIGSCLYMSISRLIYLAKNYTLSGLIERERNF